MLRITIKNYQYKIQTGGVNKEHDAGRIENKTLRPTVIPLLCIYCRGDFIYRSVA
jgi:hypothetical protein